jgi:hypothetical protein
LDRFAADKMTGVDLGDVEWYHRLRNQLYHSGNGITVERARVEAYFQIAVALFENLFGQVPDLNDKASIQTRTGEFLQLWTRFDQLLRQQLPPKDGLAYYWKREFLQSVSDEAATLWDHLREFRNNLVHGLETPANPQLERSIQDLKKLTSILEERASQTCDSSPKQ